MLIDVKYRATTLKTSLFAHIVHRECGLLTWFTNMLMVKMFIMCFSFMFSFSWIVVNMSLFYVCLLFR